MSQLATDPVQRIQAWAAATVLAPHLLNQDFGVRVDVKGLGSQCQRTMRRLAHAKCRTYSGLRALTSAGWTCFTYTSRVSQPGRSKVSNLNGLLVLPLRGGPLRSRLRSCKGGMDQWCALLEHDLQSGSLLFEMDAEKVDNTTQTKCCEDQSGEASLRSRLRGGVL